MKWTTPYINNQQMKTIIDLMAFDNDVTLLTERGDVSEKFLAELSNLAFQEIMENMIDMKTFKPFLKVFEILRFVATLLQLSDHDDIVPNSRRRLLTIALNEYKKATAAFQNINQRHISKVKVMRYKDPD